MDGDWKHISVGNEKLLKVNGGKVGNRIFSVYLPFKGGAVQGSESSFR